MDFLVDETSRTTSSLSSSYSLREIVPEREPIPVINLSDDESVEGPEMASVAPGIGLGKSIEEDPSEPTSDSEMMPELEGVAPTDAEGTTTFIAGGSPLSVSPICGYCLWREQRVEASCQQVVALREGISRMDVLFYAARQAWRQEMARAAILERELAQTREAHAAREREILELNNERDCLRQFIAQYLGTTRDSVDRARDELGSRPGCFGSQCPQANRLWVVATGADEALEQFLKFRPPEFYGEVEQEIKVELFLEQLNDIYDTLKYEDAMRVTFVAFRLREMAKYWWLKLPKLGHSRTNHGPGTIFKKNSKRNTYLVGFMSNERMSFSN
ncbi:hypothetical protein M9H77_02330 [Catharanthus roseus]|uniref:Uncharacterized protein n=1 Tax=Catharanthus roseus TaxID=4058 RepID=A0ACC0C8K9_CATRO|nr:hypothetical protein M9H77_02330 [Catharanthus roseus]